MFKQLKIYYKVFHSTFLTILAYPYELLITIVEPLLAIGFLVLFWSIVSKASDHPINLANTIAYFIMVEFVAIWALNPQGLNFANYIGFRIKTGRLSQSLIRPVKVLPYLLFENRGYFGVDFIFSSLLFTIAVLIKRNITFTQISWFLVFLILAFLITLSFCILLGALAFTTKEINSLRHSFSHIIKILSGAWVPLSYFPEKAQHLLNCTPFPSVIYTPINVLQNDLPLNQILHQLKVTSIWAVLLLTISIFVWKHNLKKYEATGL